MNPLLRGSRQSTPDLRSFMQAMNPTEAKRQVEELLSKGQLTQGELGKLFDQAESIGRMLGFK